MFTGRRLAAFCLFLTSCAFAQQTLAPTPVDLTRPGAPPADNNQSLADVARRLRSNKPAHVEMSQEEAKELFRKVDETFTLPAWILVFPSMPTSSGN